MKKSKTILVLVLVFLVLCITLSSKLLFIHEHFNKNIDHSSQAEVCIICKLLHGTRKLFDTLPANTIIDSDISLFIFILLIGIVFAYRAAKKTPICLNDRLNN